MMTFPNNFTWGVATSSYQIEGAVNEDGRGRSIWDDFCDTPGKIIDGSNGAVACDHYHLWQDDIKLIKSLNANAYRFSIAWPRVLPDGTGRVERHGLDFYDKLVDGLLEAGIEPYATLYHWDLPSALQYRGGWANRDIAEWFADYAALMARTLGDRVTQWMTINEPWCVSFLSHEIGEHAPGLRNGKLARQAAHHTLLAHGRAMQAVRACASQPAKVGIVLNYEPCLPFDANNPDDVEAARLADVQDPFHGWFTYPVFRGYYSPELMAQSGTDAPNIQPGDMALIAQHNDFLGINNYTVGRYRLKNGQPVRVRNQSAEHTLMDWEVAPEGLHRLLMRLHQETRGKVPMYVTENGSSFADQLIRTDGTSRIHDERRTAYLLGHVEATHQAIQKGADVRGYFAWSLMDNFEWAKGYQQWFGIVHVDYATQKRTVKDSGWAFKKLASRD